MLRDVEVLCIEERSEERDGGGGGGRRLPIEGPAEGKDNAEIDGRGRYDAELDAWCTDSGGGFVGGLWLAEEEDAGRLGSLGGTRPTMAFSQSRVITRSVFGLPSEGMETSS